MGPPHDGSIRRPIAPLANALTKELHLAPLFGKNSLLSVTSQVRKARGYFNELLVERSPFVDKSTIFFFFCVKIKGKNRTILTKTRFPCFFAENENSVFDSPFRDFRRSRNYVSFHGLCFFSCGKEGSKCFI